MSDGSLAQFAIIWESYTNAASCNDKQPLEYCSTTLEIKQGKLDSDNEKVKRAGSISTHSRYFDLKNQRLICVA